MREAEIELGIRATSSKAIRQKVVVGKPFDVAQQMPDLRVVELGQALIALSTEIVQPQRFS